MAKIDVDYGKNVSVSEGESLEPEPRARGELSARIRDLILSYSESDVEGTWDAAAFSRRVASRAC